MVSFQGFYVFYAYNNKLPVSFNNVWVTNRDRGIRAATLRDADKLYEPRARLNFTSKLPLHNFPKIWNNFEDHLKNITSASLFKSNLKLYF